jgi:hypothetical protein
VGIKLLEGISKQIWGTGPQQMVDLVVRQAASEQSKLNLCVVHLPQSLANVFKSLELLLHKVCGEGLCANGSTEQLYPCVVDTIHFSRKGIHTRPAWPPDLVLLHVQVKTKSWTFPFKKQKHFVDIVHLTNDSPIVQVPDTKVKVGKLRFNLSSQRMEHQGKQQRTKWVALLHSGRALQHTATKKQVGWVRVTVLNPAIQAGKFLVHLRKHHSAIH